MDRRDMIKTIGLVTGGMVIGAEAFLSGCARHEKQTGLLTTSQISLIEEIGEFILPKTGKTPGAKEAQIGPLINRLVTACYPPNDQKVLLMGLDQFKEKEFLKMDQEERQAYFTHLEKEAKAKKKVTYTLDDGSEHKTIPFYTMIRQLCIWSYLSSEIVATTAFNYSPLPGVDFKPCVPVDEETKPIYSGSGRSVVSFIEPA